jgi:hypothetical protein
MPTHDSAMLTSKLSWAHLRARWASLEARSARFCWRWICTMSATLSDCQLAVPYIKFESRRTHPSCPGVCSTAPTPPPSPPPSPAPCPRAAARSSSPGHAARPASSPVLAHLYPVLGLRAALPRSGLASFRWRAPRRRLLLGRGRSWSAIAGRGRARRYLRRRKRCRSQGLVGMRRRGRPSGCL